MLKEYYTLGKSGEERITEKKSLFIGSASPVRDEEETLKFLNNIRVKYADANHHVYAYVIGENDEIQRSSDAGEPAGTGGRPVLEAIKNANLKDTAVVVTRYFGGTLLGTGGLIRAYGKVAALALQNAGIVRKKLCRRVTFNIDYPLWGKIRNFLSEEGYCVKEILYTDQVTVVCHVEIDRVKRLSDYLEEMCRGESRVNFGEELYEE